MSAGRAAAELPEPLARAVADPRSYADWDALHESLAEIRRAHPFARAELPEYPPFFVASRLAEIREVASRNQEFLSGLGGLITREQLAFAAKRGAGRLLRPAWKPLHRLAMYRDAPRMNLDRTEDLARRLVSLPSSAGLLDA